MLWFYGNRVYETSWVVIELVERRRSCYERQREDRPIRVSSDSGTGRLLWTRLHRDEGNPELFVLAYAVKSVLHHGEHRVVGEQPVRAKNRTISLEMARCNEPPGVAQRRCPEAFLIRLRACSIPRSVLARDHVPATPLLPHLRSLFRPCCGCWIPCLRLSGPFFLPFEISSSRSCTESYLTSSSTAMSCRQPSRSELCAIRAGQMENGSTSRLSSVVWAAFAVWAVS